MRHSMITIACILCPTIAACGVFIEPGPTELPITIYTQHKLNVTDLGLYLKALDTWNTALGQEVLEYAGDKDVPQDVDDNATVVYHVSDIGGDTSRAVGRAEYRRVTDGSIGKKPSCDVLIEYDYFFGCHKQVGGATLCQSNPATFVQVLVHELAHCLGVMHNDNDDSLMHPTAINNNQCLLPEDIAKAKWALGLTRPGGAGGE